MNWNGESRAVVVPAERATVPTENEVAVTGKALSRVALIAAGMGPAVSTTAGTLTSVGEKVTVYCPVPTFAAVNPDPAVTAPAPLTDPRTALVDRSL